MTLTNPKLRNSTRLLMALPIAALAFSLAACGGAARPSEADVSQGLQKFFADQPGYEAITEDVTECLAGYLVDSELSNETLTYLADGEDKQKNEADKALTTQILQDNIQDCIAG